MIYPDIEAATIQFNHRIDIPKKRDLVSKLFAELEGQTESCIESCTQNSATEKQIIAVNASGIANVQLTQRKDVNRSRDLVMKLWDEDVSTLVKMLPYIESKGCRLLLS